MPTKRFSIRNVTPEAHARFSMGARLRNITEAQYLERLLELHDRLRYRSANSGMIAAMLVELGLETVKQEG